ncbi:MAG: DUF4031 domain-containing protein, partial [Promethearchaeota archaeon]
MIITDGVHLTSTFSLEELHNFAIKKLGLKKIWYQNKSKHTHYDLTTKRIKNKAIN